MRKASDARLLRLLDGVQFLGNKQRVWSVHCHRGRLDARHESGVTSQRCMGRLTWYRTRKRTETGCP